MDSTPSRLLVRNAVLDGQSADILIEDGVFTAIAPHLPTPDGATVVNARGKTAIPGFYNGHTHSAMTLFRSYADDLELFTWLSQHIWPNEAKLSEEDVLAGARLAAVEMIRSGTVFFNDMYWFGRAGLQMAEESGLRAKISKFVIEDRPGHVRDDCVRQNGDLASAYAACGAKDRVQLTIGPHAVYTVSESSLRAVAEEARATGEWIHVHASETRKEVEDCVAAHGLSPIAWLDRCGLLGPQTLLAHCVHLSPEDIALIRGREAVVVHNPCSNYKLCSGAFAFRDVCENGHCRMSIGTDGCSSNNNLSMFDEMKLAALSAKLQSGDPACAPAKAILDIATRGGAEAFGIHGGAIEKGRAGDLVLLDPDAPFLAPGNNLAADLVYSADTSCVDTVVVAGRVLMQNREILVFDEGRVLADARAAAQRLFKA